ncbi:MAG: Lar family restriction alleviation protein [Paracoccus sp.]|nr:Lar family restriction alleviation protein [Paracoccus sp. (in: a-proteobacteria)]
MTTTEKLQPCPFCGGAETRPFIETDEFGRKSHGLQCANGDCWISGPECETAAEAIAAWNRRAQSAPASSENHEGPDFVWRCRDTGSCYTTPEDGDVKYIRTDLAAPAPDALREAAKTLLDGYDKSLAAASGGEDHKLAIMANYGDLALSFLRRAALTHSPAQEGGFPPTCCTAWEDCKHDGTCHDPQSCGGSGPNEQAQEEPRHD